MDEVTRVQVIPEFVHQNCVKLVGNGEACKDSCALKSLSILSAGSIITFLPTSLGTCLKGKCYERNIHRSEWNCEEFFFPHKCLLLGVIN